MLIVQASDLHLFTSDEADPRAKKYLDISRPVAAWAKTAQRYSRQLRGRRRLSPNTGIRDSLRTLCTPERGEARE